MNAHTTNYSADSFFLNIRRIRLLREKNSKTGFFRERYGGTGNFLTERSSAFDMNLSLSNRRGLRRIFW
jgi:hypothetical protein